MLCAIIAAIHEKSGLGFVRRVVFAFLSLLAGCSLASDSTGNQGIGRFSLDSESLQQWKLPKKLKEISGLALTPDDRLFAVSDEKAIVYELDYRQGKIIKAFTLGDPTVRGDFEGIAFLNDVLYLVTSKGRLYATAEGNDGDRMQFETYKTGLGKLCEIEGLAQDAQSGTLLLACKKSKAKDKGDTLSVFVWSPSTGKLLHERKVEVPTAEIAKRLGKKRISPTAIVIDPQTGNFYGIAGPQRAIFEMKPNGELIDAIILPLADRHRQAEGIEITRDGKLLIADEGGKKKARLSVYTPVHKKAAD